MKIKTIDIEAKEWFDRVNGNSYFSVRIVLNYGMKDRKEIAIPFQYGYGNGYIDATVGTLVNVGYIPNNCVSLWKYCEDNKIIKRQNKKENCKKTEVIAWGIL